MRGSLVRARRASVISAGLQWACISIMVMAFSSCGLSGSLTPRRFAAKWDNCQYDISNLRRRAAPDGRARVSGLIEEPCRPEMGELSPLPSTYDLVSHHRAEERRHRHAAMGDSDVVAGRPRHRSDGGQMVAGDRPDGDAHRLRFDLADRGQQLSGAPHQI